MNFKRDRAQAMAEAAALAEARFAEDGTAISTGEQRAGVPSAATWKLSTPAPGPVNVPGGNGYGNGSAALTEGGDSKEEQERAEEEIEDLEHLQLTLQEAFFLAWALDCLSVLDSQTVTISFLNSCLY
jgi:tRNA-splicing endonuclease subunit Sen2